MKIKEPLKPFFHQHLIDAGSDEAGRGCYAGPVFAAAVILPSGFYHPLLNDSKKVNAANRELLKHYIEQHATAFAVAMVDVDEIDATNILKASQKAMHLAIGKLSVTPQFISVDGNYFIPYSTIPHQCIIKGDGKYAHIAAASILAKTYRDQHMRELHAAYPQYNWIKNKGYGTLEHRNAINQYGLTPHHRKSFKIAPSQLTIFDPHG